MKNRFFVKLFSLFLFFTSCTTIPSNKIPSTEPKTVNSEPIKENLEERIKELLKDKKLDEKVAIKQPSSTSRGSLILGQDFVNQAPSLIGSVITIDSEKNEFDFIGGYNFIISPDNIDNNLIEDGIPIFDAYVKKGFSTDANILEKVDIDMKSDKSYRIKYETIFSAYPKGGTKFLNHEVLEKTLTKFVNSSRKPDESFPEALIRYTSNNGDFRVIRSVEIRKLSSESFSEFKAGVDFNSSLISIGGKLYQEEGNINNYYEVYITTTLVQVSQKFELVNSGGGGLKMEEIPTNNVKLEYNISNQVEEDIIEVKFSQEGI